MNTVDCISERMEECFEKGKKEGAINLAVKLINKGYPIELLAETMEIPKEKLKKELNAAVNATL